MTETILILVLVVVVLGFGAMIFLFNQRLSDLKNDGVTTIIKQDLVALSDGMADLKDGLKTHLTDRLDKNQELMRDSIIKQFSESGKLIADVTQRLVKLDETNRRVVDVADELKLWQLRLVPRARRR